MTPTDEELIRSLARGEEDALATILHRHESRVRRFFTRRLPRLEDAEEASQDVFLKVARGARTFNGSGAFSPWLAAIARNVLRDRLRRRPRAETLPLTGDVTAHLEVYEREIRAEEVRAALEKLPGRYRAALALRYLAGLSYREAARELSLTTRGFETRLLRAKVMLRKALLKRGEGRR